MRTVFRSVWMFLRCLVGKEPTHRDALHLRKCRYPGPRRRYSVTRVFAAWAYLYVMFNVICIELCIAHFKGHWYRLTIGQRATLLFWINGHLNPLAVMNLILTLLMLSACLTNLWRGHRIFRHLHSRISSAQPKPWVHSFKFTAAQDADYLAMGGDCFIVDMPEATVVRYRAGTQTSQFRVNLRHAPVPQATVINDGVDVADASTRLALRRVIAALRWAGYRVR